MTRFGPTISPTSQGLISMTMTCQRNVAARNKHAIPIHPLQPATPHPKYQGLSARHIKCMRGKNPAAKGIHGSRHAANRDSLYLGTGVAGVSVVPGRIESAVVIEITKYIRHGQRLSRREKRIEGSAIHTSSTYRVWGKDLTQPDQHDDNLSKECSRQEHACDLTTPPFTNVQ